tara:strand:+ start:162 stop:425 length:264 start_codon:yes stop_codon:yes gene_type:complete
MKLYNPELEKVITKITEIEAKTVCIQLPDGMKPYANEIADQIEKETDAKVLIWLGSNFGGCDIPPGLKNVDLLICWGHNLFHKTEGW